jgi:hypothetical protein
MEGFNMNDWEITGEVMDDDGLIKCLSYKHSEGYKHYKAYYWSPEEIYVEVWHRCGGVNTFVEGGMTWSEALQYDINDDE